MAIGVIEGLLLSGLFAIGGGVVGFILLRIAIAIVPKVIDGITPAIDDQKELVRGNVAVGLYIGLITAAVIIGFSIIVAAAIIAGFFPTGN